MGFGIDMICLPHLSVVLLWRRGQGAGGGRGEAFLGEARTWGTGPQKNLDQPLRRGSSSYHATVVGVV